MKQLITLIIVLSIIVVVACRPQSPWLGRDIVFTKGYEDIYVINGDGTNIRSVFSHTELSEHPTWSPDNSQIAFTSYQDGYAQIYVMNADGTNAKNIINDNHATDYPAWSPNGKEIAYSCYGEDICLMDMDGGNQRRLTNDDLYDSTPVWSPDGTMLAFTSSSPGSSAFYEVRLINADGSNLRNLTNNNVWDSTPVFSVDGEQVAFYSSSDGDFSHVFITDIGGGNAKRFSTHDIESGNWVIWKPVGDILPFMEQIYGEDITNNYVLMNGDMASRNGVVYIFFDPLQP